MDNINIFWGVDNRDPEKKTNILAGWPDISKTVYKHNNIIYFNAPVWQGSVDAAIELSRDILYGDTAGSKPTYTIYIHSYGGCLDSALRFADFIDIEVANKVENPTSIIHGAAVSAGSLMAAVFPTRKITSRSYVMIHELSTMNWGKYSDVLSYANHLTYQMDNLSQVYVKATGKQKKTIQNILKTDTYFTPKEALGIGLVTDIIGA